ncbi:hypothetical protein [Streptomyces mirabilis]|uniref:hypothetical protein n=1 Tax=Streptomyces mirabilis TaxID=68239 RepID=UPI00332BD464
MTWEDEVPATVGRAGPGWSFVFEPRPGGTFDERWFASPGIAASRGTRAVTVWSGPSRTHRPGVFHLSVTENGEERYAFTVRGTSVSRQGSVPTTPDPDRLFPQDDARAEPLGDRRALEALAAECGARLPRFALSRGRLHSFRTRPWNRPPGPGEGYVSVGVIRSWP